MHNKFKIPQSIRFAALAVDIVCFRVVSGILYFLVGEVTSVNNIYKGKWAHIGGLIRVDETADQSVERLLKDKAGISKIYKEQLYTFSAIDRDPRGRVVSLAYIALTNDDKVQDLKVAGVATKWVRADNTKNLAYDHDLITKVAIGRLKSKISYTDIAKYLMKKEFTMTELQKTHEAVIGERLDKRNFSKKVLSLDILKDTKKKAKTGVMRPAKLYTFN